MDFETFYKAYLNSLLWSSTAEVDGEIVELDTLGIDKVDKDSLTRLEVGAREFFEANKHMFDYTGYTPNGNYKPEELAGHDFALTRNGHGTGFWDRGIKYSKELSEASYKSGEVYLEIGDDGFIHVLSC